jgi:hypothetical protein
MRLLFSPFRQRLYKACVAVTFLAALSGCDQDVELNIDYSINIFKPGPKWPNVKKLTPVQRQVYEKYGTPDCFRVFWTPDGAIKMRADLQKEMKGMKPKNMPPFSFVYLKDNKEIVFRGSQYVEQPLPETARIVIENGDPEDVKELHGGVTQWMFYSTGKLYKISRGHVIEQKEFQAMGQYLK